MNGVGAGLGSTGDGTGVEVTPNGKPPLGGSAVAVVGVGRLNLNPPVLVAEADVGAGTTSGVELGAGSAPKPKLVVLGASIDPIAGKSNSFVSAGLDLPSSFWGADSFTGDPLPISSSRAGGVGVCTRATFAGLGAAVGAMSTILGAEAEGLIGAMWALNSGVGLA